MTADAKRRNDRDAQWWPEHQIEARMHAVEVGDEWWLPCLDPACKGFLVHSESETRIRACGAYVHECSGCGDVRMIYEIYPQKIDEPEE